MVVIFMNHEIRPCIWELLYYERLGVQPRCARMQYLIDLAIFLPPLDYKFYYCRHLLVCASRVVSHSNTDLANPRTTTNHPSKYIHYSAIST